MTHLTVILYIYQFLSINLFSPVIDNSFGCLYIEYVNVDLYFLLVALTTSDRFLPQLIPK